MRFSAPTYGVIIGEMITMVNGLNPSIRIWTETACGGTVIGICPIQLPGRCCAAEIPWATSAHFSHLPGCSTAMVHNHVEEGTDEGSCNGAIVEWVNGPQNEPFCISRQPGSLQRLGGAMWQMIPDRIGDCHPGEILKSSFWRVFPIAIGSGALRGNVATRKPKPGAPSPKTTKPKDKPKPKNPKAKGPHMMKRSYPFTTKREVLETKCLGVDYPILLGKEPGGNGTWVLETDKTLFNEMKTASSNITEFNIEEWIKVLRRFGAQHRLNNSSHAD